MRVDRGPIKVGPLHRKMEKIIQVINCSKPYLILIGLLKEVFPAPDKNFFIFAKIAFPSEIVQCKNEILKSFGI